MRFLFFLKQLGLRLWADVKFLGYIAIVLALVVAAVAAVVFCLGVGVKLLAQSVVNRFSGDFSH